MLFPTKRYKFASLNRITNYKLNTMTKKLLTLLAFVSLTLVGCNNSTETTVANADTKETAASTSTTEAIVAPSQTNIVYINSDSLVRGYTLFIDLKKKFDEKAAKIQTELETKSRSFERKAADFQNKVQKGLVTRAQAAELEQSLTTEQQTVIQYRDKALAELQEEEQVMFNNINNDVDEYLKLFNAEKKYDLILSTSAMSNTVVVGNPALDITTVVLEGLNKAYAAKQTAK